VSRETNRLQEIGELGEQADLPRYDIGVGE
jgi:hypothetical protein